MGLYKRERETGQNVWVFMRETDRQTDRAECMAFMREREGAECVGLYEKERDRAECVGLYEGERQRQSRMCGSL